MKGFRHNWLMAVLLAGCGSAQAEGLYLGAVIGVMDVDVNGFDEAVNGGVVLGYAVPAQGTASWGLEAEFTTSVSKGDLEPSRFGDWEIDTQAAYAVLRVGSDVYAKLRAGYLWEDVSVDFGGSTVEGDDNGFSGGIGVGFQGSESIDVEFQYTLIEEDVNFYSVGLNFKF
jgi:hypothetical protein